MLSSVEKGLARRARFFGMSWGRRVVVGRLANGKPRYEERLCP